MNTFIFTIFVAILLLAIIYFTYFRGAGRKLNLYLLRATIFYKYLFMKLKAIEILAEAIERKQLIDYEEALLLSYMGEIYYKLNNFNQSATCFTSSMGILKTTKSFRNVEFPYADFFKFAILTHLKLGEIQKALEIYNDFLYREKYDKEFKKIKELSRFFH